MKSITVGTTPTKLADAGNRDFLHIYNNDVNPIFICYDGLKNVDQLLASPSGLGLVNSFKSGDNISQLVISGISLSQNYVGAVIAGTGIPSGVLIVGIDQFGTALTVTPFVATADSTGTYTVTPIYLTVSNGFPVAAGSWYNLDNDGHRNLFNKEVWAISAAGGADVRVQGV